MKKRSSLSKKMVGVLATALTVTPAVAVHTASAALPTIFVEKNETLSDPINLLSYFSSVYSVTNATYDHSSYSIGLDSKLTVFGSGLFSPTYSSNVDYITIHGINSGVEDSFLFGVHVVTKPTIKVQLPALSMKHSQSQTIHLTDYFADEDNNINNHYILASGLPTSGYSTDTYAYISGSNLIINSGTQPITTTIAVTARDDDYYQTNPLTSHSVTNSFSFSVDANSAPLAVSDLNGKTLDAEIGEMDIIIPKSQLFTDADGDTLYYSFNGDYGCALDLYISGDAVDIYAKQPGTYHVAMTADDHYSGISTYNFTVNVLPKLSHDLGPPILQSSGGSLRVSSSFAGSVYLVPSTEKALTKMQFDNLIALGKASSVYVTANSYEEMPTTLPQLPIGAYKLYLGVGSNIYSSFSKGIIITDSSDLISELASSTSDPRIDIGSILRYINKPANNSLKEQGKFDSTYLQTLLDLITPIVEVPDIT
jgi:hypothetical protein